MWQWSKVHGGDKIVCQIVIAYTKDFIEKFRIHSLWPWEKYDKWFKGATCGRGFFENKERLYSDYHKAKFVIIKNRYFKTWINAVIGKKAKLLISLNITDTSEFNSLSRKVGSWFNYKEKTICVSQLHLQENEKSKVGEPNPPFTH